MTDMIPEFPVDEPDDAAEPVQFKLTYSVAGEKQTEILTALPADHVPYMWTVDYFASGDGDATSQASATLLFLERVLLATDADEEARRPSSRDRFFELARDPAVAVHGKVLQQIVGYLLAEYHRVDPTRARSAGPKKSRGGRSRTGSGSTAPRSAKGRTSR